MASTAEQQQQQQQQQNQQQQQQQQTTLEFYQAMTDFKIMFPQMDDDVIEAVLRSNQGAVDTTIDQLLAMSTDNENEKIRSEIEENEDLPKCQRPQKKGKIEPASKSMKSLQKWKPPLLGPLPDSFLRIPHQALESVDGTDSSLSTDYTSEDERIAMFLQNEEFMAELRWNEDFLSTLETDSKMQGNGSKGGTAFAEDVFKERLRNMGTVSRRKFAKLTQVFTRSKKRGGRQLLPPTASCDDLLEAEESSTPRT